MRKWLLEKLMSIIARLAESESSRLRGSEEKPPTSSFYIRRALKRDFGREIARMHWSHRPFATRYDVVRITYENKKIFVPVLGLAGDEDKGIAHLGYDLRVGLGLPKDAAGSDKQFELRIEQTGFWGQLYWYLSAKDPAVKIPAWLAFWSVLLGFVGLMLGIISIFS